MRASSGHVQVSASLWLACAELAARRKQKQLPREFGGAVMTNKILLKLELEYISICNISNILVIAWVCNIDLKVV